MFCSDISNSNIDGYYNSEYPSGTSVQQRYISVLLTEMRPDILGKDKTHPQISGTIWHCSFFLHIAVWRSRSSRGFFSSTPAESYRLTQAMSKKALQVQGIHFCSELHCRDKLEQTLKASMVQSWRLEPSIGPVVPSMKLRKSISLTYFWFHWSLGRITEKEKWRFPHLETSKLGWHHPQQKAQLKSLQKNWRTTRKNKRDRPSHFSSHFAVLATG